jgi:alpha-1,2-mannosyltransferase
VNIALYNAFGGTGDELYGVEPLMYYLKNLMLIGGVAWPLAILWPLATAIRQSLIGDKALIDGYSLTLVSSALLWVMVLFSRPHKVRFL